MKIFKNHQKAFSISVLTIWLSSFLVLGIFLIVSFSNASLFDSYSGSHLLKKGASKELPTQKSKININSATKYELIQLTGIGPVLAERIIEYRHIHGNFVSISNLSSVQGLGPKKISKVKSEIIF
jgi:competence ComEA-like helix-hairpin-helix protein